MGFDREESISICCMKMTKEKGKQVSVLLYDSRHACAFVYVCACVFVCTCICACVCVSQ